MSTEKQTDRLVRALGGIGEDLIAKAAPRYGESILPTEVHRVSFETAELPDKREVRRWRIKRAAAGLAAAAVVIAAGALLWVNRERIFTRGNDGSGQGTAVPEVTTSASKAGTVTLPEPELTETLPVEYTYPKENVFVYENTLYEIDARAAFDYVIETEDGYQSIFLSEDTEYDGGDFDPVRDCLKDEYFVGMLNYVNRMPTKGLETNFGHGGSKLYSFDPDNNSPAESTQKYIVADVSSEEVEMILKYFSDKLTFPVDENDFGMLRGVYYVTAQTTVMPAGYYDYLSREEAQSIASEARNAEGMNALFRTGTNYFSFPLPIFPSPTVSTLDRYGRLGEITFYLGNGEGVFAAITDGKVDKDWNLEPISEAFRKGDKVKFIGDVILSNVAMFTSSGGQYIVRGSQMPFGAELLDEGEYFPIRKYNVMNPPPQDYVLTEADLDDIYEKASSAWADMTENFALGYPIKVDYRSGTSRGTWEIPVFGGDTVTGVITAFYHNDEWYASSYTEGGAELLNEMYRSGKAFNLTSFGGIVYLCTEEERSVVYEGYDPGRNVYLYDPEKAAPLRKWKDDGQPAVTGTAEGYQCPEATFVVYSESLNSDGNLPSPFDRAIVVDGEGYMPEIHYSEYSDEVLTHGLREMLSGSAEIWELIEPCFEGDDLSYDKLKAGKQRVDRYGPGLFGTTKSEGEYGTFRLSEEFVIDIGDDLGVWIYRKIPYYTDVRRAVELLWRNYNSDELTVIAVTDYKKPVNGSVYPYHYVEIIGSAELLNGAKKLFGYYDVDLGAFIFLTPEEKAEQSGDSGDMYFKESVPEDIVTDPETGISYVKNQLLISADLTCDRDFIRQLIADAGAEIVGYIELTNDYQIEFTEDKTPEELQRIADTDFAYPGIWNVTLNMVNAVSYE